jgi:hypothetical protein
LFSNIQRLGDRLRRGSVSRPEHESLLAQLDSMREELTIARSEREPLLAQLHSVGKESVTLRAMYCEAEHKRGMAETQLRSTNYNFMRFYAQTKALQAELFGPANPCPTPIKEIPPDLIDRFTLGGKVAIEPAYNNATYANNYPLVYTDWEIDSYLNVIRRNLSLPESEQDWFVYGTLDLWVCQAIAKYPIAGQSVVNMGSLTPWYEAMFIHFGAHPVTIDYNPLLLRTERMSFMTIAEWEEKRPRFDVGFSISSFEHDGLGMYGDPIDPDGDRKAMQKMKERIKPGGLLFLAVPTGTDKVMFNSARVYGRHRLPLLMEGWEWIDSFGFSESDYDGNGSAQPLYVLRNT